MGRLHQSVLGIKWIKAVATSRGQSPEASVALRKPTIACNNGVDMDAMARGGGASHRTLVVALKDLAARLTS